MRPWIKRILLDNNDSIDLAPGQVLTVVGPNNSGKTHFLKQLLSQLYGDIVNEQSPNDGLITELELAWTSESSPSVEDQLQNLAYHLWEFRNPHFSPNLPNEFEHPYKPYTVEEIRKVGLQKKTLGPFVDHFTRWDEPHSRIVESEKQTLGQSTTAAVSLTQNESERAEAVALFEKVFDETLSVYDLREGEVGFLLAEAPEGLSAATQGLDEDTKKFMRESPKLWFQGSGMRNVFGLIARMISDDRSIVIMDEPEAFLHPHQAWRLGFILAQVCQQKSKQLICATHDRHFLDGLARGGETNLKICRLDHEPSEDGRFYAAYQVPASFWANVRHESRVRYSHVLECLFSNHVILVEGEKDALFYQKALEHYASTHRSIERLQNELMFLPTGGNSEFAPMAKLVREMGPHVFIIGDIDLISNKDRFEATISSAVGHTPLNLEETRRRIEEIYEEDPSLGENEQDALIRKVKESLTSETVSPSVLELWTELLDSLDKKRRENKKNHLQRRIARDANFRTQSESVKGHLENLLDELAALGIFLVPWGELEDFDETLRKQGKQDWAHKALNSGVHRDSRAQDFIANVANSIQLLRNEGSKV